MLIKGLDIKSATPVDDFAKFFAQEGVKTNKSFSFDDEGELRARKGINKAARKLPAVPKTDELKSLMAKRGVEYTESYEGRVIRSVGSDESVDSDGDIVLQNWDFSQFEKNPAMPYGHDWGGLPVGVHLDWAVEDKSGDRFLSLMSLYATQEQLPPSWGDSVFRLTQAGMLRMNSVGFQPQSIIQVEDEDERKELGLGRWGVVIERGLLLENSPCLMGANHNALAQLRTAAKSGQVTADDMNLFRELKRIEHLSSENEEAYLAEEYAWKMAVEELFEGYTFQVHKDMSEPLVPGQGIRKTSKGVWYIGKEREEEEEVDDRKIADMTATEFSKLAKEAFEKADEDAAAKAAKVINALIESFEKATSNIQAVAEKISESLENLKAQGSVLLSEDVTDMLEQLSDLQKNLLEQEEDDSESDDDSDDDSNSDGTKTSDGDLDKYLNEVLGESNE